ncbi:hypothetical protein BM221_010711 [Beauveria bassiana]|uniref:Uncharacterized protein n=1 Tax=Beauveria bassiana TaxID=176275 RepID=A0A2N6N890_BEABA|nr:hypothetical protein BM221_010711 [Beauveria bassiana]
MQSMKGTVDALASSTITLAQDIAKDSQIPASLMAVVRTPEREQRMGPVQLCDVPLADEDAWQPL